MTTLRDAIFSRGSRLLGLDAMSRIAEARVIVFGIGGVGSWCAEGLVREGVMHLTIVDSDCVSITNVNRQLMATTKTLGKRKVDVLRERLLDINPEAEITPICDIYSAESAETFHLESYDVVIDAIDSLENKANLLLHASSISSLMLYSSMGAALKLDPTKIEVAEFWKVYGCPLASAIRKRYKQNKTLPKRKFKCVFSPELLENKGDVLHIGDVDVNGQIYPAEDPDRATWDKRKARINGSLVHITAIFGFTLAGLVIQDLITEK